MNEANKFERGCTAVFSSGGRTGIRLNIKQVLIDRIVCTATAQTQVYQHLSQSQLGLSVKRRTTSSIYLTRASRSLHINACAFRRVVSSKLNCKVQKIVEWHFTEFEKHLSSIISNPPDIPASRCISSFSLEFSRCRLDGGLYAVGQHKKRIETPNITEIQYQKSEA